MEKYLSLVKQRLGSFSAWKLEHSPRDYNEKADTLADVAASSENRNSVPTHLLPVGFFNYHYPSESGGRSFPILDGPYSTLSQHRRTPNQKG